MKALLQHLGNGSTFLADVPSPALAAGHVLVRTTCTAVSPGTERMLTDFGKAGWLGKARQQPERVRQVLNKVRTDGWQPTIDAVRRKLDQPIPLGYCNAGVVIGVGHGAEEFRIGDRVASNSPHAEIVSVPKNLVAKIPDDVTDAEAAFAPLAAIALHGFRLSGAAVGETVVIIGLGLVGTLAAQWAQIAGCRVIGFDVQDAAVTRAAAAGTPAYNSKSADPEAVVKSLTAGHGADAVLVCTSTDSAEPLRTAAAVCRAGGSVILLGTAGIDLPRRIFFDKEIRFQVSRSYGPGRYDKAYEAGGQDYPYAYARWTAGRNIDAALKAMSTEGGSNRQLYLPAIPTAELPFEEAPAWYSAAPNTEVLATIFRYKGDAVADTAFRNGSFHRGRDGRGIGIAGAGPFVQGTLLPALKDLSAPLQSIASKGGVTAGVLAQRFAIPVSTSDYQTILNDVEVGLVVIATPHETHAAMVCEALAAGKAVYVEKPLALSVEELIGVETELSNAGRFLHVGHNRRFAPLAVKAKSLLQAGIPCHMVVTVNAGVAPQPSGGRFLGEAGHWIDLCTFLADSPIAAVNGMTSGAGDAATAQLLFKNGSTAAIQYLTTGGSRYEKERIEIHSGGTTIVIRAWRQLEVWTARNKTVTRATQDKGHKAQLASVLAAWKSGSPPPVHPEVVVNVSRALLAVMQSSAERQWIDV